MNRFEAKKKLCDYLKRNQIPFQESVDNGTIQLTMVYRGFAPCPGGILESCIWFYEDCMEVRVYYNEIAASICKASEFKAPLFRFFNFINARVWPRAADGMDSALYNPHHLHVPRIYMSEDGYFDIMLTSVIAYIKCGLDRELEVHQNAKIILTRPKKKPKIISIPFKNQDGRLVFDLPYYFKEKKMKFKLYKRDTRDCSGKEWNQVTHIIGISSKGEIGSKD